MKRKGFSCSFQLISKGSGFSFGWISDAGVAAGRELASELGRESWSPASAGNFPATSVILLKPSISREMKYLFPDPLFAVKSLYIYRHMCSYMCVYMDVCGICAFIQCLSLAALTG